MRTRWQRGSGQGARGFALLTVIATIVVLTLLGSAITLTVDRLRVTSAAQQKALNGEIAAYSTRSTILFMLGTQRMTYGGLTVSQVIVRTPQEQSMQMMANPANVVDTNTISFAPVGNELRLDGTLYRGLGDSYFALQDDRGRFSINWAVPGMMQGLMHALRVPLDERGRLLAALRNYQESRAPGDFVATTAGSEGTSQIDTDSLAHHVLLTPFQLLSIPAWRPYLEHWSDQHIGRRLSVTRSVSINVNTASAFVMQTLPGVEAAQAKRVIALRGENPLVSESMAYALLPSIPDGSGLLMLYPSNSGTLVCWSTRDQPAMQVHYTLTPFEPHGKPWRIDYVIPLAQPPAATVPASRAHGAPLLAGTLPAQPR